MSVNTPDYPEIDWAINPDVSAVIGIPSYYWNVVTTPAVPEVVDVDGNVTTPYSPEINTVTEMSPEEKAAYDATIVTPVSTNVLSNGTPAFFDSSRSLVRSITEDTLEFSTLTSGAMNFYLSIDAQASNLAGYHILKPKVVLDIKCSIQSAVNVDVTFQLKNNVNNTVIGTAVIPAGSTSSLVVVNIPLTIGMEIACYCQSTTNIANPRLIAAVAFTN